MVGHAPERHFGGYAIDIPGAERCGRPQRTALVQPDPNEVRTRRVQDMLTGAPDRWVSLDRYLGVDDVGAAGRY